MKGASRSVGNTAAQQALIAHWQGIVKSLTNFLNTLKSNNVSSFAIPFPLNINKFRIARSLNLLFMLLGSFIFGA